MPGRDPLVLRSGKPLLGYRQDLLGGRHALGHARDWKTGADIAVSEYTAQNSRSTGRYAPVSLRLDCSTTALIVSAKSFKP